MRLNGSWVTTKKPSGVILRYTEVRGCCFGIKPEDAFTNREDMQLYQECKAIAVQAYADSDKMNDFNAFVMRRVAL